MEYSLNNLFGMEKRSVTVVGGTSGIGLETAAALVSLGADVAVIGSNEEKCRNAKKTLLNHGDRVMVLCADVRDKEAIHSVFGKIAGIYGRIDGMVYCAGINRVQAFMEQSDEDFEAVMDVNFWGLVTCCKEVGKWMLEQGYGSIVNISSSSTSFARPDYTAYAASKAAVDGFTRALACEWVRKGIRVNSVAPGLVITDINRSVFEKKKKKI